MSDTFTLATGSYEGPLETLLSLIEERKMAISEVSLAEVADAFLAYVEKLPELPLGETAQFILVASTLLLIKSRALLPMFEMTTEEKESVEELERRLARYAIVRKGAKLLRKQWGTTPLYFAKRAPEREATFSPAETTIDALLGAARKLLNTLPKPEQIARAAVAPVLALEDVITGLRDRLTRAFKASFRELTKGAQKDDRIVYFLAMLELVRNGSASVTQEKLFEDITIERSGATGAPQFGV